MRPLLPLALLALTLAFCVAPAAADRIAIIRVEIVGHTNPFCDLTNNFCEDDCVILGVIGSPGSTMRECFPGLPYYPPLP